MLRIVCLIAAQSSGALCIQAFVSWSVIKLDNAVACGVCKSLKPQHSQTLGILYLIYGIFNFKT